ESNKSKYKLLQHVKAKKGLNKLSFKSDLNQGDNYYWVSLRVRPVKNMLSPFVLSYKNLSVNKKRQLVSDISQSTHRLAVAVRRHKQEEVHTSRIPGIVTAKDGSLVAVYDARYESGRDLQGHMDIGVS